MVCIVPNILLVGLLSGRIINIRKYATVSLLINLILSRCFSTLSQLCPFYITRIFTAILIARCPRSSTRLIDEVKTLHTRYHIVLNVCARVFTVQ
jgi:hypothetical protein